MAWGPLETRIDELRTEVSRNPAMAVKSITRAMERSNRPRDRVRLLGLRSGAKKLLGLFSEAEKDLLEARGIDRAGKIATAELDGLFADLRLTTALATGEGWKDASYLSEVAVSSARELNKAPTGSSDWAIRQARTRATLLTAALVTRGTILVYGYGQEAEALRDAMEAIRSAPQWSRERNARRNRPLLSAYWLVTICALAASTNSQDLLAARDLVAGFKIPQEDVILRAQQRATVLCIDVKRGKADLIEAEQGLIADMANLRRLGAKPVYDHILNILVWIIRDFQNRTERADWIQENMAWSGYPELLQWED
jgi:hypothetical protein